MPGIDVLSAEKGQFIKYASMYQILDGLRITMDFHWFK